jgi:hypothetical protein
MPIRSRSCIRSKVGAKSRNYVESGRLLLRQLKTTRFPKGPVSVRKVFPKSFPLRDEENNGNRVTRSQPAAVVWCDLAGEAVANPVDRRRRGALGDRHVVTAGDLDET